MELQLVMITILCICSLLQLIAMIAILLVLFTHKKTSSAAKSAPEPTPSKASPLSSLEEEKLREQRKKFDDEMKAFQQMMNYNADVAYGIASEGDLTDGE